MTFTDAEIEYLASQRLGRLVSINPWRPRMLEIRARGEAIAEPTDSAYSGPAPGFDGAIIRIHPQRLISFAVNDAVDDAHKVKIDTRNVR